MELSRVKTALTGPVREYSPSSRLVNGQGLRVTLPRFSWMEGTPPWPYSTLWQDLRLTVPPFSCLELTRPWPAYSTLWQDLRLTLPPFSWMELTPPWPSTLLSDRTSVLLSLHSARVNTALTGLLYSLTGPPSYSPSIQLNGHRPDRAYSTLWQDLCLTVPPFS